MSVWGRMPEPIRLALLPALISFVMLWRALLGLEVFAPTDMLLADLIIAQKPPGTDLPEPQNPMMGDVVDTFLPWRMLVRDQLAEGRFPLWNPYNLAGTHLHANLQSQILSPFNLLWLALPPVWGLAVVAALKWTLAGLGMALLLRRLGLCVPAAVFGSVAYQLSGPIVAWFQWPIADGLVWLPWVMWAALGWLDTGKLGWLTALSAFVAFEWLAGHIETTFHSLVLVGVFVLAAWVALPVETTRRISLLLGCAAAGLLGTALAAAQLLPFFDVLPRSFQWWLRSEASITHFSMPLQQAWLWLAPHGFGWAFSAPGGHNWIEDNPYVGALTLLLAACGFGFWILDFGFWKSIRSWRGFRSALSPRQPLFWLVTLVVSLGMAYGVLPFSLLKELPGFSSSLNWRLVCVAGMCLIVLAAMGLDRLLALKGRSATRIYAPVAIGLALLGAVFLFASMTVWSPSASAYGGGADAWRAWAIVMFCAGGALVLARMTGWLTPGVFAVLVVGLLTLDMMKMAWGFNATNDFSTFYPKTVLLDFAAKHGPTERMAVVGEYLESNVPAGYRAPDYRLYDATIDNRFVGYTRLMSPETFRKAYRTNNAGLTGHLVLITPTVTLLSAIGIKWVLSPNHDDPNGWQPVPSGDPIYKRTLTKNGFSIWENTYALPYVYLSSRHHVIRGPDPSAIEDEAFKRMQSLSPDTRNINQVEDPNETFPDGVAKTPPQETLESAQLESYAPGEITVRVRADVPRLLVVNESWSPDWRATLDGQPAEVYRTNYVVQGLAVPPGEHTIRLVYDPPAFRWGVGISLLALAGWLGLLTFSLLKSRSNLKRENK